MAEMDALAFNVAAIVRSVQRNHATSSEREVQINARVPQTWVRKEAARRFTFLHFSPLADS